MLEQLLGASPLVIGDDPVERWLSQFSSPLYNGTALTSTTTPAGKYQWHQVQPASAVSGSMWGSPWGTRVTFDSRLREVLLHASVNQSQFNSFITLDYPVYLVYRIVGRISSYSAVTRNGLTSRSYGSFVGGYVDALVYRSFSNPNQMVYHEPYLSSTVEKVWTPELYPPF